MFSHPKILILCSLTFCSTIKFTFQTPYIGKFPMVKFSKNLRESHFEKIFSKILLLSQLSSCVAIEIRKIFSKTIGYIFEIFENKSFENFPIDVYTV